MCGVGQVGGVGDCWVSELDSPAFAREGPPHQAGTKGVDKGGRYKLCAVSVL